MVIKTRFQKSHARAPLRISREFSSLETETIYLCKQNKLSTPPQRYFTRTLHSPELTAVPSIGIEHFPYLLCKNAHALLAMHLICVSLCGENPFARTVFFSVSTPFL